MAGSQTKQSSKAEFNTFIQGLITEASPLNFPPNASRSEENFELNRDGTRDRRFGLDLEIPFAYDSTIIGADVYNNYGVSTFVWKSPGGQVDSEFLVAQFGNVIKIYDNKKTSISIESPITSITISNFPNGTRFSYGTVNGNMVIAAGVDTIFVVDYSGGVFPTSYQRLLVRDLWGIEVLTGNSEVDLNYRPAFDIYHYYNLQNQGWGITRAGQTEYTPTQPPIIQDEPGIVDPIQYFAVKLGQYPSNGESVYTGLQFQAPLSLIKSRPSEQMIWSLYNESRGAAVAPAKGYFIIDLLRRGQSRVEASIRNQGNYPQVSQTLYNNPADYSQGGASVVRGFSGRMFYAGFNGEVIQPDARSPSLESFVVFSQLVKNSQDLNKCYQDGDPTSREAAEIVDTDGGFIRISGAEKIVGMAPLGSSLIVFATNGVWEISGGSDYGFSAANYKVTKLSSIGTFSESSIVEEVGKIFYWSLDGIYVVGTDQFQTNGVQNLTQTTIQTLYENIPNLAKNTAVGVYDLFTKKVRWVFNEGTPFTDTSSIKELVFDTVLQAFSLNTIKELPNNVVNVSSIFVTPPFQTGTGLDDIAVGVDQVFAGPDLVIIESPTRISGLQSVKYLVTVNDGGIIKYTFGAYNNVQFLDWKSVNGVGVDAKGFVLTGAQIARDSSVHKQIPYLTLHMRRTENGVDENGDPSNPSGVLVRSQWDFANNLNSHKWSSLFQGYRYTNSFLITAPNYDNGFELITTKNKLRGRGKAFSMYMETEPLKDCRIIGWNLAVNGNGVT